MMSPPLDPMPTLKSEIAATAARMVVEELTMEEQIVAARTSYAYWAWEQYQTQVPADCPEVTKANANLFSPESEANEMRIRMAMREAKRHFVGQSGDYASSLERFKHTVHWRKVRLAEGKNETFLAVAVLVDGASSTYCFYCTMFALTTQCRSSP